MPLESQAEYDPKSSLQHYPLPMAKYGFNPYLENLYRIVLSDSRRHLVGGYWSDSGETAYHWRETYPEIHGWVLERWQRCLTTRRQWDEMVDPISGWLINGPYPDRGEYYLAFDFGKEGPAAYNIDKVVGAVEASTRRSLQDLDDFNRAEYMAEEKETHRQCQDEIRDAFTAYGGRAFASSRVARGIKTVTPLMTAEEAGLPVPRRRPKEPLKITSRRTVDVRDIQFASTLVAGKRKQDVVVEVA